jgi:POT family proton-dependent oligopeptide transporter
MVMPHDAWWWPSWLVQKPAQMQALNPLLVMLLIPFNNIVLYPLLRKLGFKVTALRRMGWGIAFSGFAWIVRRHDPAVASMVARPPRLPGRCCPMPC